MKNSTLKTIGKFTLIGTSITLSILGVRRLIKKNPKIIDETGKFLGNVAGGFAEVYNGGQIINYNSYWINCEETVVVKINKYYPSNGTVVYTKYNRWSGRFIDTCQCKYTRFLRYYRISNKEFDF